MPLPFLPQWKEMVGEASQRISRPRQIYTGELRRKFMPVCERQLSGRISGALIIAAAACFALPALQPSVSLLPAASKQICSCWDMRCVPLVARSSLLPRPA